MCLPLTLTTKVQKTLPDQQQSSALRGRDHGWASCVSDPRAIWFRQKSPDSFTLSSTWTNQSFILPETLDLAMKNPENVADPWTTWWLRAPTSPCSWKLLPSPKYSCPSVAMGDCSQDPLQNPNPQMFESPTENGMHQCTQSGCCICRLLPTHHKQYRCLLKKKIGVKWTCTAWAVKGQLYPFCLFFYPPNFSPLMSPVPTAPQLQKREIGTSFPGSLLCVLLQPTKSSLSF